MTDAPDAAPERGAWHIITCEFPPQVGGVSDYTLVAARSLAAVRPVHVWCPHTDEQSSSSSTGVVVHRDLGHFSPADLRHVGNQLNRWPGSRHLFVQWVPQGFGYRSVNVGFALWIAWRTWFHRDRLHLMVHEPFLPLSWHPLRLGAALVQRAMLAVMASGAERIWLSTTTWRRRVSRWVRPGIPIEWLPLPVPQGRTETAPTATGGARRATTVGHFSTYPTLIVPLLVAALDRILTAGDTHVLLAGRGSIEFRQSFLRNRPHHADRVTATGVVCQELLGDVLGNCAVMVQPYPDGVTSRRTSTLTLLALGKAVVSNLGALTESFWSETGALGLAPSADGAAVGDVALALLKDPLALDALRVRAVALYDEYFDARHMVTRLEGAA